MKLNKEDGGNRGFILLEQLSTHIKICIERITKSYKDYNFIFTDMVNCEKKDLSME